MRQANGGRIYSSRTQLRQLRTERLGGGSTGAIPLDNHQIKEEDQTADGDISLYRMWLLGVIRKRRIERKNQTRIDQRIASSLAMMLRKALMIWASAGMQAEWFWDLSRVTVSSTASGSHAPHPRRCMMVRPRLVRRAVLGIISSILALSVGVNGQDKAADEAVTLLSRLNLNRSGLEQVQAMLPLPRILSPSPTSGWRRFA